MRDPVQGESERYVLTLVGESHLDLWGVSLEEYGEEIGHFLRTYRGVWDGHRERATLFTGGTRRSGSGATFVLTSSGLRHMGLRPGHPDTGGRGFLGYPREEIFWKDAFELVHKDDLPMLWFLVSLIMEEPGASESVEVRFRDAGGGWDLMDVSVLNVLEAPTDGDSGLIVVNVRHARIGAIEDVKMQNGKR